jgi:hypothetical protein
MRVLALILMHDKELDRLYFRKKKKKKNCPHVSAFIQYIETFIWYLFICTYEK